MNEVVVGGVESAHSMPRFCFGEVVLIVMKYN